MAGKEYEVGGSIIHSANKLMNDLLEETGNFDKPSVIYKLSLNDLKVILSDILLFY